MNKITKIIFFTLCSVFIFFVLGVVVIGYKGKISKIFLERELGERFNWTYNQELIQSRQNVSGIREITMRNELGEWETTTGTYFDSRRDILFYPDSNLQYIDYRNLSGEWMLFGIPKTDNYEIGISICYSGIFDCETTYYKNPVCLELIYIPWYLERKREEIMTGCEIVDISKEGWSNLFYSIKY